MPKKERTTEKRDGTNCWNLYKEKSKTTNAASIEEEADAIVDHVDSEMSGAWLFLAKGAAKSTNVNSI